MSLTARGIGSTALGGTAIAARLAPGISRASLLLTSLLVLGGSVRLDAQGMGAGRLAGFRMELGAVAATALVNDGNGVSLRQGVGGGIGADALWALGGRTTFVATVRGATAPLHLRSNDRRWSPGSIRHFDFGVRVERPAPGSAVFGAGLVVALLHGPEDLIPFREGEGTVYGWGPELALSRPMVRQHRLDLLLAGDAIRISPPSRDTHLAGGWIGRLRLGLRHGF